MTLNQSSMCGHSIAGRFAAEQPFVVVQRAIDYWREYLDDIDRAIQPIRTAGPGRGPL